MEQRKDVKITNNLSFLRWCDGKKVDILSFKDVENFKILTVILVHLHLPYLKDICLDEHVLIASCFPIHLGMHSGISNI